MGANYLFKVKYEQCSEPTRTLTLKWLPDECISFPVVNRGSQSRNSGYRRRILYFTNYEKLTIVCALNDDIDSI